MQRDRDDEVRFAKPSQILRPGGERPQGGDACQMSAEFQRKDKGGNGWLVIEQGTNEIKRIAARETIATEMIATGSKRNTTTRATGRADKR
jgi:hypothetical protein